MRLGRSAGWVAKIEAGERYPTTKMIPVLAGALETTPERLVACTDWSGSRNQASSHQVSGHQASGKRRKAMRQSCRPFAQAAGVFTLPRSPVRRKRRVLYTDYSKTALEMGRRLRQRRDLDWRNVLRLPVTNAGEAGFVVHVLERTQDGRVVALRPLDVGLRLMVYSGSDPRVYSGDRRRWCILATYQDVELVIMPQVPFLGDSGAGHRADFVVGAAWDGLIAWFDVEIDEYAHTLQRQQDAHRDADVPIETIRIPEERLVELDLFDDLMRTVRQRLLARKATVTLAA